MIRAIRPGITGVFLLAAAPLLAAQFPAQQEQPRPQASGPQAAVVATVNGDAITRTEVQQNVEQQVAGRQVAPEVKEQLRKQVLDSLIESRLVEQYARKEGPDVKDQEVEAVIDRFKQQLKQQSMSFDEFLRSRGYTEDILQKRVEGSLAWQKYQQEQLTESNLREFFDQNKETFGDAGFDEARQKVAQAYVTELWQDAVKEMRPKAEIKTSEAKGPAVPNRQPVLPDRR